MASLASEIDPAAEPHVVVEEPSSAGGGEDEAPPEAAAAEVVVEREAEKGKVKEEEEDVGECEFCLYMKAGSCKETFVSWEQCMQAVENEGSNIVERCSEATVNLMKCMEAHADYYGPVFRAEQHVSDQAEAGATIAADTDKNKGEESAPSPASDETKKEEAVAESPADAKGEVVEQAASSTAAEEAEKEEAAV